MATLDYGGMPYDPYGYSQSGQPNGIPDPNNPGYDTNGNPLPGNNTPAAPTVPVPQGGGPMTPTYGPGTTPISVDPTGQWYHPNDPTKIVSTTPNVVGNDPTPPAPPGPGRADPFNVPPPAIPNVPAFVPPSATDVANTPGYQFRLQQGLAALATSAAAKGTLGDSSTAKDFIDYGENTAEAAYADDYSRALQTYGENYTTQFKDPWTAAMSVWVQQAHNYLTNQGIVVPNAINYGQA